MKEKGEKKQMREFPLQSIPLRVMNSALSCMPMSKLDPNLRFLEEYLEKEVNTPGVLTVFGDQTELKVALRAILNDIPKEPHTPLGTLGLYHMLRCVLQVRQQVMDYIIKRPEIQAISIHKPIIIVGLHRTGTTLLYNLMGCDSRSRSPQFWEMNGRSAIVPPPTKPKDHSHPSYHDAKRQLNSLRKLFPESYAAVQRAHTIKIDGIEEECTILLHQLFQGTLAELMGDNYWDWLYNDTNKAHAYKYLYRYLQMLSSGFSPQSHWLLKSPIHLGAFSTFLDTFPDARLVMTHRDPKKVLPSVKSLYSASSSFCRTHVKDNGPRYVESMAKYMDQVVDLRNNPQALGQHQFIDVAYHDIVKDPIGTVLRIYQHYKLDFTDQFVSRMKSWLNDNPQHKHGVHHYSLENYGMDERHIEQRWRKYYDTYGQYIFKT